MGFLDTIFRTNQKAQNNKSDDEKPKGTPINKSLGFLTHIEIVMQTFNYLTDKRGFHLQQKEWHSREYLIQFKKENIEINILYEPGELPYIKIKNNELPYDESKNLHNSDIVESFNDKIKEIRENYNLRRKPISKDIMEEWKKNDNLDFSELDEDYKLKGRSQHIELLKEAAITVDKVIKEKLGVLAEK